MRPINDATTPDVAEVAATPAVTKDAVAFAVADDVAAPIVDDGAVEPAPAVAAETRFWARRCHCTDLRSAVSRRFRSVWDCTRGACV